MRVLISDCLKENNKPDWVFEIKSIYKHDNLTDLPDDENDNEEIDKSNFIDGLVMIDTDDDKWFIIKLTEEQKDTILIELLSKGFIDLRKYYVFDKESFLDIEENDENE